MDKNEYESHITPVAVEIPVTVAEKSTLQEEVNILTVVKSDTRIFAQNLIYKLIYIYCTLFLIIIIVHLTKT